MNAENEDKEIEETDDVTESDDTNIVSDEEESYTDIQKLRARLKESEKKAAEYLDGWQRMKADFVNLRKRDEQMMSEIRKFANEGLIDEILPIVDSFEMAMANKEAWEKVDSNWRVGVEYIYNKLIGVLSDNGLKEINPIGEKFDPTRDTPAEMVPVENEEEDGKILEVVQKGYTLNGKLTRSPRVKVGAKNQEA